MNNFERSRRKHRMGLTYTAPFLVLLHAVLLAIFVWNFW